MRFKEDLKILFKHHSIAPRDILDTAKQIGNAAFFVLGMPDLKWQRIWPYCKVWTRKPVLITSRASTFSDASCFFARCERRSHKNYRRAVGVEG